MFISVNTSKKGICNKTAPLLEYGAITLDKDRGLLGIRSVDLGNLAAALE